MMPKIDYAVLIHRLYDNGKPKNGGLDILLDVLISKGSTVLYVESPLLPSAYPYITVSVKSKTQVKLLEKIELRSKTSFIARLQEIVILFYLPIKYGFKNLICVTSDPLTSAPAIILRKLGLIKYVYYHCIDYSEKRFPNRIVNGVYKWLLNFGVHNADLVGCVTKRIELILSDRGVQRLFYVPNSPSMSEFIKYRVAVEQRVQNSLVMTCAGISNKYRIIDTVNLFAKVLKDFPDATLTIIGSKEFEPIEYKVIQGYIDTLKLKDKVTMTGQLSKAENILQISKSWVGLAFYDKSHSHVNFGDSLKIREYAALGIPIVSDKTTPTSLEMLEHGAGIAVEEPWDAYEPLVKLLADRRLYNDYVTRELNWASLVDKDKIIDELVKNYFEKNAKN